ncbi:MAG: hypothetical protein U1F43_34320 [Myxococcota bacterium]
MIVVGSDGVEQTTRFVIARDPTVRNQAVWAAAGDDALALFVPDPAAGGAQLVAMGPERAVQRLDHRPAELVQAARRRRSHHRAAAAARRRGRLEDSAPASAWTAWQAGQSDSV